jgi:hypothetical protein
MLSILLFFNPLPYLPPGGKELFLQDTLPGKKIGQQDTIKPFPDSLAHKSLVTGDSGHSVVAAYFNTVIKTDDSDTSSTCHRNSIADITFYDSTNFIRQTDTGQLKNFPFVFLDINRKIQEEKKADLVKHLKDGDVLAVHLFHNDWILPVILLTVFLYGVIYAESVRFFRGIIKFVSFSGLNESVSRDIGAIFQWQSTLFNLAAFINISLFAFLTALWYNFNPVEKGIIYWLVSLGIVVSAITLRHFVCVITGNISGEKEIFREYLVGIYEAYRLAGVFLLIIVTLILYTAFIPVNILFYAGFSMVAVLYFIRIFRLFFIFINRHVSIFYLILYLCALEILPVVIIIKYVTGLV